jgi:hypothetical protein
MQLEALSDEDIIERLTQVRGIGRWTVEMMLMFQLQRPDVLPVDDFGVRNGFRLAYRPQGHAHGRARWRNSASAGNLTAARRPGTCGAPWIWRARSGCRTAAVRRASRCRRQPSAPQSKSARAEARRQARLRGGARSVTIDLCPSPRRRCDEQANPAGRRRSAAAALATVQSCRSATPPSAWRRRNRCGAAAPGARGSRTAPCLVAAANPLAAQAGCDVLRAGGLGRRCRRRDAGRARAGRAAEFRPRRRRVHHLLRCAQRQARLQRPRDGAGRREPRYVSGRNGNAAAVRDRGAQRALDRRAGRHRGAGAAAA